MKPSERRAALESARLYLVAGPEAEAGLLADVLAAGVDVLQLRDKHGEAADVARAAAWFKRCADDAGVPFIVNDRVDLAYALDADGVHLGQRDVDPAIARDILGPHRLIGRSTHDEDQIERAAADHAAGLIDYIAVGPVHPTATKPGRPAVGTSLVSFAAGRVAFPWFAIGGIDAATIAGVAAAGARRIVVVRAITRAEDPVAVVAALTDALPCP